MNIFEMTEHRWDTLWMEPRTMYDILPVVVLFILIGGMAGPASAITIEYFPDSWRPHTGFIRPTDTYASNAALMTGVQTEAEELTGITWVNMTDTEKVWEMTKFVRRHGLSAVAYNDVTGNWSGNVTTANLYNEINAMATNQWGHMCLGHAAILMHLCDLFSYEAYTICGGDAYSGLPGDYNFTHATTLVRLSVDGHYIMAHFDPYFGDQYVYENLTPMSFFVMQDYIDSSDYDLIFHKTIGYKYDMPILSNQSWDVFDQGEYYYPALVPYYPHVANYMQFTFVEDNSTYNTRVWRVNNWFIAPFCASMESAWSLSYTHPYQIWGTGEIYKAYDTTHTNIGIAAVEARET